MEGRPEGNRGSSLGYLGSSWGRRAKAEQEQRPERGRKAPVRAGPWGGERGREVNSVGSLLMDGSREMTALSAYWMWNVREGSLQRHCGPADLGSWKNKRKTEVVAGTEWKPGQQDWEGRSDDFSSFSLPLPPSSNSTSLKHLWKICLS